MNSEVPMSTTIATSPVFGVASTAVIGALQLVDISRLGESQRRAFHVASAVFAGAYVALTIGGTRKRRVLLRSAAGLATSGLALRFADASDAFDSRLEQKLREAGARNPRRWMAVGAAVLTFAGYLSDRAAAKQPFFEALPLDQLEHVRPVDPAVSRLVEGMLGAGNLAGAPELLAQLRAAKEVSWGEALYPTTHFRVPEDLPRAVPHDQVFPVRAQFSGSKGETLHVLLHVFEGKIDQLTIEAVDADGNGPFDGTFTGWPDPAKVTYVVDRADGTSAPITA
ncbi:hypothetical protein [Arthrobacter sp. D2-10]